MTKPKKWRSLSELLDQESEQEVEDYAKIAMRREALIELGQEKTNVKYTGKKKGTK